MGITPMKPATRGATGPSGGGMRRGGGGGSAGPAVDPEEIPSWQTPSTQALESAASEGRPLVIYFPAENDTDASFAGKDIAHLSKNSALFVRIPYNPDREESPWAADSAVPVSKILSENPSREYDIKVGVATVIVADAYGNEYFRFGRVPAATELKSSVDKVKEKAEDTNKKLQKNLDAAKAAWEAKDAKKALGAILKNFKEDVIGLAAQEETIRLYHEVMDAARARVGELKAQGGDASVTELKAMKATYKGTDVAKEIDEAIGASK
ncbi:MAG: hypothetical protein IT463_08315 [Planctomycetes bacterium]|nr:hypothetical protein [Planctomycetota bacterium]